MAFSVSLLVLAAVGSVCILPVLGTTCPDVWDGTSGFNCPQFLDTSDEIFCCSYGKPYQYCCDFYDYYGYSYLSTGAIVGVVCGGIVVISLIITAIIACCVCCRRAPPRYPVSTHIRTTTVAHRSAERPATIMTTNAPPGYYTPSVQAVPPQPQQHMAPKDPKPGKYQQFQNEPGN